MMRVKVRLEGKLHSHRHKSVCENALLGALQNCILSGGHRRRAALCAVLLNGVGCFQQFLSTNIDRGRAENIDRGRADDVNKCAVCKNHCKMKWIYREENLEVKGTVHSQYASIKQPKYNFLESI